MNRGSTVAISSSGRRGETNRPEDFHCAIDPGWCQICPITSMAAGLKSLSGERSALRDELAALWSSFPDKLLFLTLCVIWGVFFHVLGNSTFGYKDTPSLFGWMNYTYNCQEDD